jgi:hypothetical protein
MESASKQRRHGVIIVIIVLIVVCVWWAVFSPLPWKYQAYRRETKIKETLQAVKPPGANVIGVTTLQLGDHPQAVGVYSVNSEFEEVKAHYIKEFVRHGFVYKGEDTEELISATENGRKVPSKGFRFCAPDFGAFLAPMPPDTHPVTYMVLIKWKDTKC